MALLAGRDVLAAGDKSANPANDVAILNSALAAELEAIAAYGVGAGSGLLKGPVLALATTFQGHHKQHADVLAGAVETLGGTAGRRQGEVHLSGRDAEDTERCAAFRGRTREGRGQRLSRRGAAASRTASLPRRRPASSVTRPCTGRCCARQWATSRYPQLLFHNGRRPMKGGVCRAWPSGLIQCRPCLAFTTTGCSSRRPSSWSSRPGRTPSSSSAAAWPAGGRRASPRRSASPRAASSTPARGAGAVGAARHLAVCLHGGEVRGRGLSTLHRRARVAVARQALARRGRAVSRTTAAGRRSARASSPTCSIPRWRCSSSR